jgi:hypothetical protein
MIEAPEHAPASTASSSLTKELLEITPAGDRQPFELQLVCNFAGTLWPHRAAKM